MGFLGPFKGILGIVLGIHWAVWLAEWGFTSMFALLLAPLLIVIPSVFALLCTTLIDVITSVFATIELAYFLPIMFATIIPTFLSVARCSHDIGAAK